MTLLHQSPFLLIFFIFGVVDSYHGHGSRQRRQYPVHQWPPSNATRTSSMSGTYATDGNNKTNEEIYNLLTRTITQGFTTWKIKMFNDRIYLDRYRRSYWFGNRYYKLDNRYYLETRDTCRFELDAKEKSQLHYEEQQYPMPGTQINHIYYQCQRYVEFCCGLECCRNEQLFTRKPQYRPPRNPWSGSASGVFHHVVVIMLINLSIFIT